MTTAIDYGSVYTSPAGVSCIPIWPTDGGVAVRFFGSNFSFVRVVSFADFAAYAKKVGA